LRALRASSTGVNIFSAKRDPGRAQARATREISMLSIPMPVIIGAL
jgi:hypothetical protein